MAVVLCFIFFIANFSHLERSYTTLMYFVLFLTFMKLLWHMTGLTKWWLCPVVRILKLQKTSTVSRSRGPPSFLYDLVEGALHKNLFAIPGRARKAWNEVHCGLAGIQIWSIYIPQCTSFNSLRLRIGICDKVYGAHRTCSLFHPWSMEELFLTGRNMRNNRLAWGRMLFSKL